MTKKHIIAIAGFKGSGKDTVGMHLRKQHGFATTSFALNLKKAVCAMFGWKPSMLEGTTEVSRQWREQPDPYWSTVLGRTVTPRSIMQTVGTDVIRRKFFDNFWVASTSLQLQNSAGSIAVTDARFKNELSMIKQLGGHTVLVCRGSQPSWYNKAAWLNRQPRWLQPLLLFMLPEVAAVHISERDWIGWQFDYVIHNDGDLNQLQTSIDAIVAELEQVHTH
jgi:hypothetical protein